MALGQLFILYHSDTKGMAWDSSVCSHVGHLLEFQF